MNRSDKKSAVKKKAAIRAAFRSTSGLGLVEGGIPELSNIEERIQVLMGGEGFATGDTYLQIEPFNQPSQENESPSILAPASGTYTNMPVIDDYVLEVPGTSVTVEQVIDNLLHPEMEVATTANPTRPNESIRVNFTNQPTQQLPRSEPARNTTQQHLPNRTSTRRTSVSSRLTSLRRLRRRILQASRRSTQASPPSLRRTTLMSMAEKFLQVEQQRLDLDNQILALMERNSERDHILVEATKAMGEGLKALAEAIKR